MNIENTLKIKSENIMQIRLKIIENKLMSLIVSPANRDKMGNLT